jgi:hypothetical protein
MSTILPAGRTRSVVIRPHHQATPVEMETRRILRRLSELTAALDGEGPQFDRRAGIAATALLMAGDELDVAGVRLR